MPESLPLRSGSAMEVVGYVPGYVKGTCQRGSNLWSSTALLTVPLTSGNALRWPVTSTLARSQFDLWAVCSNALTLGFVRPVVRPVTSLLPCRRPVYLKTTNSRTDRPSSQAFVPAAYQKQPIRLRLCAPLCVACTLLLTGQNDALPNNSSAFWAVTDAQHGPLKLRR